MSEQQLERYLQGVPRALRNDKVSFWRSVLPAAMSGRAVMMRLALPLADLTALALSGLLSVGLYHALFYAGAFDNRVTALFGGFVALLFMLVSWNAGLYGARGWQRGLSRIRLCAYHWSATFVIGLGFGFVTKTSEMFSRGSTLLFFVVGFLAVVVARTATVRIFGHRALVRSAIDRRALLVRLVDEGDAALRDLPEEDGWRVVAEIRLRQPSGDEEGRIARLREDLTLAASTARLLRPDDVVIEVPWASSRMIAAALETFMSLPASVHLRLNPDAERLFRYARTHLGPFGSVTLVGPPLTPMQTASKRALDIVVATVGLVALSPLLAAIAVLVRLDSKGPAIFRQRRYGFNWHPFAICKFRTMTVQEDGADVVQASRDDPRITRIGRHLRRFNIDELPQLWNVLKGDMSIVGPRPHAMAHDQAHVAAFAEYGRRHNIKPGISGWAQIHGLRGEIRCEDDILARVDYDLFYMANWSLWLDIKIIGLTVLSPRAYMNAR